MNKIISFILCNVIYFLCYILRTSTNSISPILQSTYGFTIAQVGSLNAIFYYTYTISQIPIGIFIDKLGPRINIILGTSLLTMGSFLFSQSDSYPTFLISQFISGFGASFIFLCIIKFLYMYFKSEKHVLMTSITQCVSGIGALMSSKPLIEILRYYNFSQIFGLLSLISFLSLLAMLIVLPKQENIVQTTNNIKHIFTWEVLISGLYCLMICSGSILYIEIHGGTLLKVLKYAPNVISNYALWASIGSLTLVFIWNPLRNKYKFDKNIVGFFVSLLGVISSIIIINIRLPYYILYTLSFIIGGVATSKILFMSSFSKNVNKNNIGVHIACINIFIPLGSSMIAPISNFIYKLYKISDTTNAIQGMFYVMPCMFLGAAIIALINSRKKYNTIA